MRNFYKFFAIFGSVTTFYAARFFHHIANAQTGTPLSVPIPSATSSAEITSVSNIGQYVQSIYTFGIIAAAFFAIVFIVYAAIQFIISRGDTGKIMDARDRITSAVYGLLLIIGATLILQTINPEIIRIGDIGSIEFSSSRADCPLGMSSEDCDQWRQNGQEVFNNQSISFREQNYLDFLNDWRFRVAIPVQSGSSVGFDLEQILKEAQKNPEDRYKGITEGDGSVWQGPLTVNDISSRAGLDTETRTYYLEIETDVTNTLNQIRNLTSATGTPDILSSQNQRTNIEQYGTQQGIQYSNYWEVMQTVIQRYSRYSP